MKERVQLADILVIFAVRRFNQAGKYTAQTGFEYSDAFGGYSAGNGNPLDQLFRA
ncbi:hypothetical protein D3C73_1540730 [compost metagenome]